MERDVLSDFLFRQRWFGAKDAHFARFELSHFATFEGQQGSYPLTLCDVLLPGGETQRYFLPLSAKWGSEHLRAGEPMLAFTLAKLRSAPAWARFSMPRHDEDFVRDLVRAMGEGRTVETPDGRIEFSAEPELARDRPEAQIRAIGGEQSNVSVIVDERIMLKIYRRHSLRRSARTGGRALPDRRCRIIRTPRNSWALPNTLNSTGDHIALAIAFAFVPNQGDAWNGVVEALDRGLEDLDARRRGRGGGGARPTMSSTCSRSISLSGSASALVNCIVPSP